MSDWESLTDECLPYIFHMPQFMENGKFVSPPMATRPHYRFGSPSKSEGGKLREWFPSGSSVGYYLKMDVPDLFEREKNAFLHMKDRLLSDSRYRGKYVAIYKKLVVDFDEDEVELIKRVYAKHGYVPVYVEKVEQEKHVFRMYSPRVYRK